MEWYYLVFLAALLASFIPILRAKVLVKEHATEFVTTLYLFISLMLLPSIVKIDWGASLEIWLLMYLKALLLTGAIILGTKAAKHMEVSSMEPLRNFSVIFLIILAFIFLGERLNAVQGIGIILILLGAYILETRKMSLKFSIPQKKFVGYLMLALFLTSICSLLDKVILKETTVYSLLMVPTFFLTIHLLIIQCFKYDGMKDVAYSIKVGGFSILAIAALAVASELSYLFAVATPVSLISLVITLRRTSILLATVMGGEMFHEHNLFQKIVAAVIMLAGSYLVVA